MTNSNLSFQEQCGLILLEKFADKVHDYRFQEQAEECNLDVEDYMVMYCRMIADKMAAQFAPPPYQGEAVMD